MRLLEEFERCWPWLAAAAAREGDRGPAKAQLRTLLTQGQAMLWPGDHGALITQCLVNTEGQFLHCWLAGGKLQTILEMRPGVEAWGRAMGCEFASIEGRKGWDRLLQPLGYRRSGIELRKVL